MQENKEVDTEETFIKVPSILDKYKIASGIVQKALQYVTEKCLPGEDIANICNQGNIFIHEQLKSSLSGKKSKKIEKGIAFPTCISVNNICGHFSPLKDESHTLKSGDLAKIDLGVHVDGFISQAATTILIDSKQVVSSSEHKQCAKKHDAYLAAYTAFNAAIRLIRQGNTNSKVTQTITKICEAYGCNHVEGVLSHKVKKHIIDGNDVIIGKVKPEQKVDEKTFAPGDVYVIDILVSSGEGKVKGCDFRSTVFKRVLQNAYLLKMDKARAFFSTVNRNYPTLPFSIADFQDVTMAKFGVKQCLEHDLLTEYPVLQDKPGEFVVQFKGTVAVLPTGVSVLVGLPPSIDESVFKSDKKIEDQEILKLLEFDLNKKAQKKAKKAAAEVEQKQVKKEGEEEVKDKAEEL